MDFVTAMNDSNHSLRIADSLRDCVINVGSRLDEILERLERIEAAIGKAPVQPVANTCPNLDSWVDTKEAARILGIAASTLYKDRHVKSQKFPYSKLGGIIRYRVGDLVKLMEERKVGDQNKKRHRSSSFSR